MSTAPVLLLYAVGEQDIHLTGTPSMTYFKSMYMRHTPFLAETFEIPFDTPANYGRRSICTIPAKGDIITDIKLKTKHAALYSPYTSFYCWPTWPPDIPSQPTMYLLISGNFVPAIEAVPTNIFYSTYNLFLWAQNYYPSTIQLSASNDAFVWTGTTTIYFLDQQSAVFFGMNPRLPDNRLRNVYGFNITTQRTADFTFFQSGWVQGTVPPRNSSYYDGIGTRCIEQAQLITGGQVISEINGSYIDLKNDMDIPYENQQGLTVLEGKNDTSAQIIPRVCYTSLDFGTEQIPVCALYNQDLQVSVQFSPISNLVEVSQGGGNIFTSNSYTQVDLRNMLNQDNFDIVGARIYNNILMFKNRYTGNVYTMNTFQQISTSSAYKDLRTSTIPEFAYYSGRTINSNVYGVPDNYRFMQRISTNSVFVTNINTTQTSTYQMWEGGQYGYSLYFNTNETGDRSRVWAVGSSYNSAGKYVYVEQAINYNYLPTSGISTAWYTASYTSPSLSLTHTFFGTTSPSSAALLEWVNYVKARDPAITANTVPVVTPSGSNCTVQSTFTTVTNWTQETICIYFGYNKVIIRYDTSQSLDSPAAYTYYQDLNRLFSYNLVGQYGWGDPNVNETLNLQNDGRYLYKRYGNYLVAIDTLNFTNASGYQYYNWTSLNPRPNIFYAEAISFDGTYGYLGVMGFTSAAWNFSRFRIGSDLSQNSNWTVFNSFSSLPWTSIVQNTTGGSGIFANLAGFDGRYIYYVGNSQGASPFIFVYDVTLPFQASSLKWISKHWAFTLSYSPVRIDQGSMYTDCKSWVTSDTNYIYISQRIFETTHTIKNFDGTVYKTLTGIDISATKGAMTITKYAKTTGIAQWVVWLNGVTEDPVRKIKVDASGNLYLACRSPYIPTFYNQNNTVFSVTYGPENGFGEGVVAKVSSSGMFQWVVRTGTFAYPTGRANGVSAVFDIAIDDATGDSYICGTMNGPGGIGNYQQAVMNLYSAGTTTYFKNFITANNLGDAFIAKLNSSGTYQWAANISSVSNFDIGTCIEYSPTYGVIISGCFGGPTAGLWNADGTFYGSVTRNAGSVLDTFVIKYDSATGAITGTKTLTSGTGLFGASSSALSGDNLYLASISSTTGVNLSNISLSSLTTNWNVQMYGPALSTSNCVNNPIVTAANGNVYVTCGYSSSNLAMYNSDGTLFKTYTCTPSAYRNRYFYDLVTVQYSSTGFGQWSTTIQGNGDQIPVGIRYIDDSIYTFYVFLSNQLSIDSNVTIYQSNEQFGETSGGSIYHLVKHSSVPSVVYQDRVGLDNRFVSSQGVDITGLNPNQNVGWGSLQGPRYFYLYESNRYFSVNNPILWQYDPYSVTTGLETSLIVDYVYLMKQEVDWIKYTRQDYVFETLQRMSIPVSLSETWIPLRFHGPVKELFLTLLSPENQNTYSYSNLNSMALYFNGEQLLDYDSTLFQVIEPWETKVTFPSRNVFLHHFGSPVNFSRIRDKTLRIKSSGTYTADIYAKVYNVIRFENGLAGSVFNSYVGLV